LAWCSPCSTTCGAGPTPAYSATTIAGAHTVQRLHNTHSHQKTDVIINLWRPRRLTGPQHRTHRPLAIRKRKEGTESSCSSVATPGARSCMLASPPPANEQKVNFFTYTATLSALMSASRNTPQQLACPGCRSRGGSASQGPSPLGTAPRANVVPRAVPATS
jgi:hypothetical protein